MVLEAHNVLSRDAPSLIMAEKGDKSRERMPVTLVSSRLAPGSLGFPPPAVEEAGEPYALVCNSTFSGRGLRTFTI